MIVTLDFETYYDKQYSLSKMTTESYIRDSRFEVIGLGIAIDNDAPTWYAGDEVARIISRIKWEGAVVVAHNARFDAAILSWRYGVIPKMYIDTLSMAVVSEQSQKHPGGSLAALAKRFNLGEKGKEVVNALGKRLEDFKSSERGAEELEKYGEYCKNDVMLTRALMYKLLGAGGKKSYFPKASLPIIDCTIRMFADPVLEVDSSPLRRAMESNRNEAEAALTRCREVLASLKDTHPSKSFPVVDEAIKDNEACKRALMSNDKTLNLFLAAGVKPDVKRSVTTGKDTWSLAKSDPWFMEMMTESSPAGVIARTRAKIKSRIDDTRSQRLLEIGERGPLPVALNYRGAHTGRFTGAEKINLQNLPRGSALRDAICAPKGYKLVAADSSQIEARVLAWCAGETGLLLAFKEGRDVYSEFACRVYGKPVEKGSPERFVGKTAILGLGYGMGSNKFRSMLAARTKEIDHNDAVRIINIYRNTNVKIVALWSVYARLIAKMAAGERMYTPSIRGVTGIIGSKIVLPDEHILHYPHIRLENGEIMYNVKTKLWGGFICENITQALANSIISTQMAKIARRYRVVLQVHDEIVAMVPEDEVAEAVKWIIEVMSEPPEWAEDLPLAAEAGTGDNYGACK